MKKIFKYTLAAMALAISGNAVAQNPYGAYYIDGFAYGHQINPAKDYDRKGYFSTPLVGNLNVSLRGNLNMQDLLYTNPKGSGLVTYLHPSISVEEALGNLHTDNKVITELRYDIFSVGYHTKNTYQTISLGIRTTFGMNVPYGLFELTKDLQNKSYDIKGFGLMERSWAELAYGYSRNVNSYLRVGGKLKALIGLAYAQAEMEELTLDLKDANQWAVRGQLTAEVGVKGFTWGKPKVTQYSDAYKEKHPGATSFKSIDFNNIDVDGFGIGGYGLAVDLGAELDLGKLGVLDGLKANLSVLDIGFINWSDVALAQNKGKEFKFDGFQDIKVDDGEGTKLGDQTDDLGDRLSDLYAMEDAGTTSKTTSLGVTVNAGVEYTLPAYDKLSFGLLSTTRLQGDYGWNEERLSANYNPTKWLGVGVSGGVGTFGTSVGWIVNVHPKGCSLYVGGDCLVGKISKQGVPLNSNAAISMGITFPLGSTR